MNLNGVRHFLVDWYQGNGFSPTSRELINEKSSKNIQYLQIDKCKIKKSRGDPPPSLDVHIYICIYTALYSSIYNSIWNLIVT